MLPNIHFIITTIIAIWVAISSWLQFRQTKEASKMEVIAKNSSEFIDLKMKVAVIEERLHNQTELLNHLDSKLDEVMKCL
jgi:hypothetical protein